MKEVLNLLPVLTVAIIMNIGAGLYYNIEKLNMKFDWKFLMSGIFKAIIVAGLFVGTSYCFDKTDLSSIGVTPSFMIMSAITLYVSKAVMSLGKILGIDINKS